VGTAYTDDTAVSGEIYFYVVRPTSLNANDLCQSNEVEAHPRCGAPSVNALRATKFNSRYYWDLRADSQCYDEAALKIYIGDSATPAFKAGPFKDEDIVRVSKAAAASVKPGTSGVTALISVKGQAKAWAVDPLGEVSPPITIPIP
jgi:hypothetical protein